jgi:hypothetical protein
MMSWSTTTLFARLDQQVALQPRAQAGAAGPALRPAGPNDWTDHLNAEAPTDHPGHFLSIQQWALSSTLIQQHLKRRIQTATSGKMAWPAPRRV